VMADVKRLVPTTVGVLDARDHFRRFSMHVGSDVTVSFSQAEAGTKSQTNISGGGYSDGERVNISASLKGRIWSHNTADSLMHWRNWCDAIGAKLLDDTISIDDVIGSFILPAELRERPAGVLLAVEWPWSVHQQQPDSMQLSFDKKAHEAAYTDLVPDTTEGDTFRFRVRSASWDVTYEAAVEAGRLRYRAVGEEVTVTKGKAVVPLSMWLNDHGVLLMLEGDRVIQDNLIFKPTWDAPPFDRSKLKPLDWNGTDLKVESQTHAKLANSIQCRAIAEVKLDDWDVVLDDDGTGEIADVVALRIDAEGLLVRLVHCKFSHGDKPGARVADLYEVCGQAQKSIVWRRNDLATFFRTLENRARRKQQRDGVSPFEVGDLKKLYDIGERANVRMRRMEIVIVQPGLSASAASQQQLDLLASTEAYLRTTINAPLAVWCSA
jgi:hypothetical protein